MSDTEMTRVTSVDRARAAQMVTAYVSGDLEMFLVALDDANEDAREASVFNLLRVLAEELAGILVEGHGQVGAAVLMRALLAQQLAAVDE